MSKSKYNVVNPDEICDTYGADTLRMYEMFWAPLIKTSHGTLPEYPECITSSKNSGDCFTKRISG